MKNILQIFNLKKVRICMMLIFLASFSLTAQDIVEGFDDITTLAGAGWAQVNESDSPNLAYFQGNAGVFPSQSGAANAYIGVNFNSTFGSTINNWLMTPARVFKPGDVITFYTRETTGNPFPDRLRVKLSLSGGSTSTSNFTTSLVNINPNLVPGGYPETWTQYTITLTSTEVPIPNTLGRIGFHYDVTNAGPVGANSNYIGIDEFTFTVAPTPPITGTVPALSVWGTWLFGLIVFTLGLIFVFNFSRQTAVAGVAAPRFSQKTDFFPFDKTTYIAATKPAMFVGLVGFVLIQFIWGEIIVDDLVGMSLVLPIVTYIMHLFYLDQENK